MENFGAKSSEKAGYLTLKEAAEYMRMAYQTARIKWPSWSKFGVHAYKIGRRPIFKASDLDRMIELHRVN